jgi:hypothetical protein
LQTAKPAFQEAGSGFSAVSLAQRLMCVEEFSLTLTAGDSILGGVLY